MKFQTHHRYLIHSIWENLHHAISVIHLIHQISWLPLLLPLVTFSINKMIGKAPHTPCGNNFRSKTKNWKLHLCKTSVGGDLKSNLTLIDINNISFYLKIANITDRVQHAIFDRHKRWNNLKSEFRLLACRWHIAAQYFYVVQLSISWSIQISS